MKKANRFILIVPTQLVMYNADVAIADVAIDVLYSNYWNIDFPWTYLNMSLCSESYESLRKSVYSSNRFCPQDNFAAVFKLGQPFPENMKASREEAILNCNINFPDHIILEPRKPRSFLKFLVNDHEWCQHYEMTFKDVKQSLKRC